MICYQDRLLHTGEQMNQVCKRPGIMNVNQIRPFGLFPVYPERLDTHGTGCRLSLKRNPYHAAFRQLQSLDFRYVGQREHTLDHAELLSGETYLVDGLFNTSMGLGQIGAIELEHAH